MNYFTSQGYDYLKMDFLSHAAMEGVHYDTNVTTGIQAYNKGMQMIVAANNAALHPMYLNESIAPDFPRISTPTAGGSPATRPPTRSTP